MLRISYICILIWIHIPVASIRLVDLDDRFLDYLADAETLAPIESIVEDALPY